MASRRPGCWGCLRRCRAGSACPGAGIDAPDVNRLHAAGIVAFEVPDAARHFVRHAEVRADLLVGPPGTHAGLIEIRSRVIERMGHDGCPRHPTCCPPTDGRALRARSRCMSPRRIRARGCMRGSTGRCRARAKNRAQVNGKNTHLTVFESLADPAILTGSDDAPVQMNAAGHRILPGDDAPCPGRCGAPAFGRSSAIQAPVLDRILREADDRNGVTRETADGRRVFALASRTLPDVWGKCAGRVVRLRDVTDHLTATEAARDAVRRRRIAIFEKTGGSSLRWGAASGARPRPGFPPSCARGPARPAVGSCAPGCGVQAIGRSSRRVPANRGGFGGPPIAPGRGAFAVRGAGGGAARSSRGV